MGEPASPYGQDEGPEDGPDEGPARGGRQGLVTLSAGVYDASSSGASSPPTLWVVMECAVVPVPVPSVSVSSVSPSVSPTPSVPLAVYIHWPFCVRKCPFCDLNAYARSSVSVSAWHLGLKRALEEALGRFKTPPRLRSLFFGGGTPSLMPVKLVAELIDLCRRRCALADAFEVTLEAEPSGLDRARARALALAGVNRLSLGVQTLSTPELQRLGRLYDRKGALQAWEHAQACFPHQTMDLLYGRPDQTLGAWEKELQEVLALGPRHVSLYQLTYSSRSAWGRQARRKVGAETAEAGTTEAGATEVGTFFRLNRSLCAEAGLQAYETSNFAMPGEASRHNLAYWRYRPYLGVGPGAQSRLPCEALNETLAGLSSTGPATDMVLAETAFRTPETWLERATCTPHAREHAEILDTEQQTMERWLMGLRLTSGVRLRPSDRGLWPRLTRLAELGDVELTPTRARPTLQGALRLDALVRFLFEAPVSAETALD